MEEKRSYDEKMEQRKAKEKRTGKKTRGKTPKEPTNIPEKRDQYNFTDPESRIMKTSKGFDQCYNGQAAVNDDMVIVGAYSNSHANDKQEFLPTINTIPNELGEITNAVADTGYYSEENILKSQKQDVTPIISIAREKHNSFLHNMLADSPPSDKTNTVLGRMTNKLNSKEGKGNTKKENKQ